MTDTTTARPDYLTAPIVAPGDQTIDAPLTGLEQVIEAAMQPMPDPPAAETTTTTSNP